MPILINGKEVSEIIQQEIAAEVELLRKAGKK